MRTKHQPVYLERRTYRQRRLRDAARLLPILGVLLFIVPLLWTRDATGAASTGYGFAYIFAVWAGLIVVAGWLSHRLDAPEEGAQGSEPRS